MKKLFILVIILTSCALLNGGAAVYQGALPKTGYMKTGGQFYKPMAPAPTIPSYGTYNRNLTNYSQSTNPAFNPNVPSRFGTYSAANKQMIINPASVAAMQYSTKPAGQQPIQTSSWWNNIKDTFMRIFYGPPKRAEIERQFASVIESLSKGDTTFKSPYIKFKFLKKQDDEAGRYQISYFIGGEEIAYQVYLIRLHDSAGYLAGIKVEENYRGYGIGRLLIKAALAHLKSKKVKKVVLHRGRGNLYSSPEMLDKLFKSLGFKESPRPVSHIEDLMKEYELYFPEDVK